MPISFCRADVLLTERNLEQLAFLEKVATEIADFSRDAFDRRATTRSAMLQILDAATALLLSAEALAGAE